MERVLYLLAYYFDVASVSIVDVLKIDNSILSWLVLRADAHQPRVVPLTQQCPDYSVILSACTTDYFKNTPLHPTMLLKQSGNTTSKTDLTLHFYNRLGLRFSRLLMLMYSIYCRV